MTEATSDTVELPAESVGATHPSPVRRKPNKKRAPVPFDKRFVLGKRIAELTAIFGERAGLDATNPDPVLKAAVEKAALLTGLAEQASAGAARADPKVGLDDVVRLNRLADLCVRRLRLDRHTKQQPLLANVLRSQGGAP
jgi:hypothetical protein